MFFFFRRSVSFIRISVRFTFVRPREENVRSFTNVGSIIKHVGCGLYRGTKEHQGTDGSVAGAKRHYIRTLTV